MDQLGELIDQHGELTRTAVDNKTGYTYGMFRKLEAREDGSHVVESKIFIGGPLHGHPVDDIGKATTLPVEAASKLPVCMGPGKEWQGCAVTRSLSDVTTDGGDRVLGFLCEECADWLERSMHQWGANNANGVPWHAHQNTPHYRDAIQALAPEKPLRAPVYHEQRSSVARRAPTGEYN